MNNDPNERLTAKVVAELFNIPVGTLGYWRYRRKYDKRLPRYHKYVTGKVFYIRSEIEEDLKKMEIETSKLEVAF